MNSQVLLLILWGIVPLSTGCHQPNPVINSHTPQPEVTRAPLAIRIRNSTNRAFDRVVVGFPEQHEDYGSIPAGSVSPYRAVAKAYRYAYGEIKSGTEEAVLQPIDYVGEALLEPGRYTYRITFTPYATSRYTRAQLELVVDE